MCQFDVVATSYLLYLLFQICYTVAIIVAKVTKENVHMLQLPQSVIQKKCLNWKNQEDYKRILLWNLLTVDSYSL